MDTYFLEVLKERQEWLQLEHSIFIEVGIQNLTE
jgi:hypothetical protein